MLETEVEREILMAVFASRVTFAKMTEEDAKSEAAKEWLKNKSWIYSKNEKPNSFLWFCDTLDQNPDAVRRAIVTRVK